jgi:hypothetical protein
MLDKNFRCALVATLHFAILSSFKMNNLLAI